MKFFISYSRSVQDKVREIIESLRDDGEDVWWDQDLRAGQDWWGTILSTIESCQVCLFMVSEKSVQSPYCMDELRYALARNRLVLPYVMDGPVTYAIPDDIMKGRIQYETYSGTPSHLKERIRLTCSGVDWGQYKDRYASRPPEPNTGTSNLVDRLDKAISLANEGYFDEAIKGFSNVGQNDYASYGEFCHTWIDKINRYKELADMANRPTMKKLAAPKWEAFVRQYSGDDFFDPLGVKDKLGLKDKSGANGMSAKAYASRAYQRPDHDYDLKIADYTEALRLDPAYVDAYVNRGLSYADKGDHTRAIGDYTEAIRLYPNAATAYVNRALSYAAKGDYDRAIADCTEALRLNPDDADAYNNRGASYEAKRDYARALTDYTEALRLNPDDADAYNNRGVVHAAKQEHDEAIIDYMEAIRLNPHSANAYYNLGISCDAKGEFERARANYTQAIRLEAHADAFYSRGASYHMQGQYENAIADYDQALRLDPTHSNAAKNRQSAIVAKRVRGS
jgi:tetratricopeptide (TPR) repeat protein